MTLKANPRALRSYDRDISTLFGGTITSLAEVKEKVGGKIVVMSGFGNPALTSLIEEWGGIGLIAVNPGVDIHWGTCTTIWGSPDLQDWPRKPKIPVVAVNNPDGQKLMALAAAGGEVTIRTELLEGWFAQKIPVVTVPGRDEPEKFALVHGHYDSWDVGVGDNATGDATLLELARVLWRNRDALQPVGSKSSPGVARPFTPAAMRVPPGSLMRSRWIWTETAWCRSTATARAAAGRPAITIPAPSPRARGASPPARSATTSCRRRRSRPCGRPRPAITASTISACRAS